MALTELARERRRRFSLLLGGAVAIGALVVGGIGVTLLGAPSASPTAPGSLAPGMTPAGGISRERAIQITGVSGARLEHVSASARLVFGHPQGSPASWMWVVTYSYFPGPTAGEETVWYIDFFSGVLVDKTSVVA